MKNKIIEDINNKINQEMENVFTNVMDCTGSISVSGTYPTETITQLNALLEQLKPEYAILINNLVSFNKIIEINNLSSNYHCNKLLAMSRETYDSLCKVQSIFSSLKIYYT